MILALAHDWNLDEKNQRPIYYAVAGIAEHINATRGERNNVIHRHWYRHGQRRDKLLGLRIDADGKLRARKLVQTTDEVEALATRIANLHRKIIEIQTDFENGRLVASPPISRKEARKGNRSARRGADTAPTSPR